MDIWTGTAGLEALTKPVVMMTMEKKWDPFRAAIFICCFFARVV
jgi:hypothetical protein